MSGQTLSDLEYEFLDCLLDRRPLGVADRKNDRARQFCRRHGLAEYSGKPKRWSITSAGISKLSQEFARRHI